MKGELIEKVILELSFKEWERVLFKWREESMWGGWNRFVKGFDID